MGGAERLVLESLPRLTEEFDVQLTTTPLPWEQGTPLAPGDAMSPWRLLLGRSDLLYTHLFLPGLLARIRRAFGSRSRWVHAVHFDSYAGLPLGRLLARIDRRWVYPGADRIVAVSPRVADGIRRATERNVGGLRLLENALDLSPSPRPGRPRDEADPVLIGTVAMLRAEKGVDDLIRALRVLLERGVDATLRIAGDGPERSRLELLAGELGVAERVEFLGYVTPVDRGYEGLDVYVQPSRAESFGLAALESLRYDVPLVVSPDGNLPVCVGEGRWGVVADQALPRDVALADAVQSALTDRDGWRRRAEEGRKHWAVRLDPARRREREVETLRGALLPRVVHVAPIVTQGEGGGLQRQVLLQTRALDAAGHRTFVLQRPDPELAAPPEPGDPADRWSHVTRWETGSPRLSGRGSSARERWLGLRFTVGAIPALVFRRRRFDLIHAHQLFSPTLVGALVKTVTGKPLVVRVTASGEGVGEVSQLERLPLRSLRMWAVRRIDAAIALTETMRDELVGVGIPAERVHVIPNAVAIPTDPLPQPRRSDGPYVLLFVGRISVEKRLDTAIRAIRSLVRQGVDVRLRILGRPDLDRDPSDGLRELAAALDVSDRIEWAGYTSHPAEYRAAADAFLLPSRSEGMSNALLEAAADGMVCVASDIPQNRSVTGDEGARYFPVGDHEALAIVVAELASDRSQGGMLARRTAREARARVLDRNAPERVAGRVSALYATLTGDS